MALLSDESRAIINEFLDGLKKQKPLAFIGSYYLIIDKVKSNISHCHSYGKALKYLNEYSALLFDVMRDVGAHHDISEMVEQSRRIEKINVILTQQCQEADQKFCKMYQAIFPVFKPGDLIYGLSYTRFIVIDEIERQRALQGVKSKFYGTYPPGSHPLYLVDHINDYFLEDKKTHCYIGAHPNEDPRVKVFREFLESHQKWNPLERHGAEFADKRIRQACKAGIAFTTTQAKNNIHFLLDGIPDMEKIPLKQSGLGLKNSLTGERLKSVTGVELRYCYRQRKNKSVMEHIIFWYQGKQVDPPWEWPSLKAYWEKYIPKSEIPGFREDWV